METVFESEFLKINYYPSNAFLETIWTTTIMMETAQYRNALFDYLNAVIKYRPVRLLIDGRQAAYTVTPEDQDWINLHIYPPAIEAGLKRLAFLVGKDIFLNVSLEQMSEDSNKNPLIAENIIQRFFDDYDKALAWLNEED